jgi:hypothetical protein
MTWMSQTHYLLDILISGLHWMQFELLPLGLAWKLGLHPVTLACLADIFTTSFPK